MPNLVAIDVSVADGRIRLAFSDRDVAAAYAAYLRAQDLRPPPHHHAIPGYQRLSQLHATTKEVSLSLPAFITWFITCRPDDEDTLTFTSMPEHAAHAARWADAMLLFERAHDEHQQHYDGRAGTSTPTPNHHLGGQQQLLYVRRLWSRAGLLKRLEEARRMVMIRVGSPWGNGGGGYYAGGVVNGVGYAGSGGYGGGYGMGGNGLVNGMNGLRTPVAMAVPGRRRGDIWW